MNLVQNIGMDADGTNITSHNPSLERNRAKTMDFPLGHPIELAINEKIDQEHIQKIIIPNLWQKKLKTNLGLQ